MSHNRPSKDQSVAELNFLIRREIFRRKVLFKKPSQHFDLDFVALWMKPVVEHINVIN